ncbi:MAG: hypothetical protein OEW67_15290 [Cyclobacteriaceae bacterium]|nr:hypothetical protein [Cyclobacteriaceae bacterium]
MLAKGIKISWKRFTKGFIYNLTKLIVLIISNAILFASFMIMDNTKISALFMLFASLGYILVIIINNFTIKYREKEFAIRKMLGANFIQILFLVIIENTIYLVVASLFSLIIVEQAHHYHWAISQLSLLFIIWFIAIVLVLILLLSIIPAIRVNITNPLRVIDDLQAIA